MVGAIERPTVTTVIAAARRRQQRRRLALTAIAVALLAPACVGAVLLVRDAATPVSLTIYLVDSTTPSQAARVVAAVTAERGVRSATFVSKGAALATMQRRYPDLTKDLAYNPLPPSIRVSVADTGDVDRIVSDLRAKRLSSIATIRHR